MKLKLLVVLSVVFCVQVTPAFSQDKLEEWEPHGSLSFTLQERYFGLRNSRILNDDWMLWTNLYLDLPRGFFTNIWWSVGLDDDEISSNYGDEVHPTFGWKGKICDLDMSISATLINLYPVEKWWHDDAWVQSFTLSKSFSCGNHVIRPEFWVEWLSKTDDFDNGALVLLPNIKHFWKKPFDIDKLTFSHTTMLVWDDGFDKCKNSSDGLFFRWQGGLEWELSKNTKLILPGLTVLTPLTDPHDGRGGETSLNFAIRYSF